MNKEGWFLTGVELTIFISVICLSLIFNNIGDSLLFYLLLFLCPIGILYNLIFLTEERT